MNQKNKIIIVSAAILLVLSMWGISSYNQKKELELAKSLGFNSIEHMQRITSQGYKDMKSWQERYKKFGFASLEQMKTFNQLGYKNYKNVKKDLEMSPRFFINTCNGNITREACKNKNYLWLGKIHFHNGKPSAVIILNNDGTQQGFKSEKIVRLKRYPLSDIAEKYVIFNGKYGEENFWSYDELFAKKAVFFNTLEEAKNIIGGLAVEDSITIPNDLSKILKSELEFLGTKKVIELVEQTKKSLVSINEFNNHIFKAIECVDRSNKKEFFFFSGSLSDVLTTTAYSLGLYYNSEGSINFTKQKFNGAFIFSNKRLSRGSYSDELDRYEITFAHPVDSNATYPNKSFYYIKKDGTGFAQDLNRALQKSGYLRYHGSCTSIDNAGERFHQYWQLEKNATANKAIKKINRYSVKPKL